MKIFFSMLGIALFTWFLFIGMPGCIEVEERERAAEKANCEAKGGEITSIRQGSGKTSHDVYLCLKKGSVL